MISHENHYEHYQSMDMNLSERSGEFLQSQCSYFNIVWFLLHIFFLMEMLQGRDSSELGRCSVSNAPELVLWIDG